jgi:hypothetical protein
MVARCLVGRLALLGDSPQQPCEVAGSARSLLPVGLTRCLRRIQFPAGGMVWDGLVGLLFRFVVGVGWLWCLRRILIPCGGNPSVACGHPFGNVPYGKPPLSGEARPKCRLRRLAVGLLRSPLEERFTGLAPKNAGLAILSGRQAVVSNSGVMVRMGPIVVCRPPHNET